ncbi:pentatricopeptide repeat-containing protein [Striga asiatica]|uniref:Pentatricopeptide repeat-containing protein n=1 Tax=Striga asiatica TaxID=4170 RepID=A0A5A7PKG8_STRAF|nr:pentatricopeptide repeat-containing protein [Striga asiatica]
MRWDISAEHGVQNLNAIEKLEYSIRLMGRALCTHSAALASARQLATTYGKMKTEHDVCEGVIQSLKGDGEENKRLKERIAFLAGEVECDRLNIPAALRTGELSLDEDEVTFDINRGASVLSKSVMDLQAESPSPLKEVYSGFVHELMFCCRGALVFGYEFILRASTISLNSSGVRVRVHFENFYDFAEQLWCSGMSLTVR